MPDHGHSEFPDMELLNRRALMDGRVCGPASTRQLTRSTPVPCKLHAKIRTAFVLQPIVARIGKVASSQ